MDTKNIKTIVENVCALTGCKINECTFTEDGDTLWCSISTPDSRFLIGRDGEALKSFNHLVKKMAEKEHGEEALRNLQIDVNGYQKQHMDSIRATAHMLAERARYFKSSIEAEPMPAFERRVMHMFLEQMKDIKTESKGEGRDRKVVITFVENFDNDKI